MVGVAEKPGVGRNASWRYTETIAYKVGVGAVFAPSRRSLVLSFIRDQQRRVSSMEICLGRMFHSWSTLRRRWKTVLEPTEYGTEVGRATAQVTYSCSPVQVV